ncbi:MAG: hypothetical protein KatS3mg121_0672 [Gammaproteobacteria bacterium]|nr:MAG: hypothetical protein KatS3mg121_0672 [Gammaproteobacteria bacterium]
MTPLPALVAHRGWPARYPENTLAGLAAALAAGARAVEFDVQLSRDRVPFLSHDATLERCTNGSGRLFDQDARTLARLSAGEPRRFGGRFGAEPLPSLARAVTLLARHEAMAFVELKSESLERFGRRAVLERVLRELDALAGRVWIIAFDRELLALCRALRVPAGWILPEGGGAVRDTAERLQPAWLVADRRFAPRPLWPGPWSWVLYVCNDLPCVQAAGRAGAGWVETDDFGPLAAAREAACARRSI